METLSALLALCAGNSPVAGELQRPVTRGFGVSLICVWIHDWVNSGDAGDLRLHRAYYDVIVMNIQTEGQKWAKCSRAMASSCVHLECGLLMPDSFIPGYRPGSWVTYSIGLMPVLKQPNRKPINITRNMLNEYVDGLVQRTGDTCLVLWYWAIELAIPIPSLNANLHMASPLRVLAMEIPHSCPKPSVWFRTCTNKPQHTLSADGAHLRMVVFRWLLPRWLYRNRYPEIDLQFRNTFLCIDTSSDATDITIWLKRWCK